MRLQNNSSLYIFKYIKYIHNIAKLIQSRAITFSELKTNVIKLASALDDLGIKKGDKIGIYLPNCLQYVYSYLACFCLGAVGVPLDFMLKNDELISCLEHSDAKLLIASERKRVDFKCNIASA